MVEQDKFENTTNKGVKFDQGKNRYDLVPAWAFDKVVEIWTVGAVKYGDRNWEQGLSWGRVFAACMRHLWAFWRGEDNDPDDGKSHLAHAVWCCIALLHYSEFKKEFDDRAIPGKEKKKDER